MTSELLSIREASDLLGVSQLRVRELIRKGRLDAQKISDDAGERWTILVSSARSYLLQRPAQPANGESSGHQAAAAPRPATSAPSALTADLIAGLEKQLGRVKQLVDEIGRVQAYLDGLRSARTSIEAELRSLRGSTDRADGARKNSAKSRPAKEEAPKVEAPKEEAPKVEAPKEEAPKVEAPKAQGGRTASTKAAAAKPRAKAGPDERAGSDEKSAPKPRAASGSMGAALQQAGIDLERQPAPKKPKAQQSPTS